MTWLLVLPITLVLAIVELVDLLFGGDEPDTFELDEYELRPSGGGWRNERVS